MAEQNVDASVSNRFMSSLSRSLQALCHGFMEFNSGIEIIGYINLNIDSGVRVDYVLNEKVHKSSPDHSMTFVSNSFLAKKDPNKKTQDRSCSPVSELNASSPSDASNNGKGLYDQQSTYHPYSSHSLRGSAKRSWKGGSKGSRKRKDFMSQHLYDGRASYHSSMAAYASQIQQLSNSSEFSASYVNPSIKTELVDKNEQIYSEHIESSYLHNEVESDVLDVSVEKKLDAEENQQEVSFEMKDSFLQQEQSNDGFDQSTTESVHSDNNLVTLTPNLPPVIKNQTDARNDDPPTIDDQTKSIGDSSSFEVIEIGEEDEDVQAMFAESQKNSHNSNKSGSKRNVYNKTDPTWGCGKDVDESVVSVVGMSRCEHCDKILPDQFLKQHISQEHGHVMPFTCHLCGKGYFTNQGLRFHMDKHEGRTHTCCICKGEFQCKYNLKRHMSNVHDSVTCLRCSLVLPRKLYDEHLHNCFV